MVQQLWNLSECENTSLTSGNDPLIIVDGVLGDLSMLTSIYPTDIESFTILKDASETAQYGSRGLIRCD